MMRPVDAALVDWFGEFAEQGIFTTDTQLVVTRWNRWLERHAGRTAKQMVGRPLLESYPDLAERGLEEPYREALQGRGFLISHLLHGYLLPMPTRVGEQLFANMPQRARIAPLLGEAGVIGTITVIDDVSERVASEAELRKQIEAQRLARTSAEKALRLKDEFLATLSHEIRTPLNAVLGWARILTERELEPELLSRALNSIYRNATVQARMIDDLLDTARIMAGKLRLQMQPVDLLTVSISAMDVLSPAIDAKRIELRKSLDPSIKRVLGDPDRLQQIIWNLLSNAAKFTEADGTIDVRLEQVGRYARITIADTGKGIEPEFLPYIFDRFRQADSSSSRREGGLGLGLALVRELVELHGGTVQVQSAGAGKGSTFTLEFPTVMSPEFRQNHLDAASQGVVDARALEGMHVLVVEDEEDARALISTILLDRRAKVTAFPSCGDALAFLRTAGPDGLPDVLVSDIGMAREDGYHLIRQIRELPSDRGGTLPAVAVTGYAGPEDRTRALQAGYHGHVPKPVDPVALTAAIAQAVNHTQRSTGPETIR
jgi:signal transduction histidine kinase/ActR/RegA family two-component response regulator